MANAPSIDISRLSPQERLDLIGDLCESLEGAEFPLSDALKTELDRRIDRFDEDRPSAAPWSAVRARLRPNKA